MDRIDAPFSAAQVLALNAYQVANYVHPFTCGVNSLHRDLVATPDGWICPDCDYRQRWAHAFMADPSYIAKLNQIGQMAQEAQDDGGY